MSDPMSTTQRPTITGKQPGSALRYLEFKHVGPFKHIRYEPAERLNIITGDNSLGKTLLLDCIWWALSETWIAGAVTPSRSNSVEDAEIDFCLLVDEGVYVQYRFAYDWRRFQWRNIGETDVADSPSVPEEAPLVIYGCVDGSFAVYDPSQNDLKDVEANTLHFSREQVWNGLPNRNGDAAQWRCNGLIRDWIAWQISGDRYKEQFDTLKAFLRTLSPGGEERLVPGEPTRLPHDSREIPTLRMPYGEVPVIHTSSAIQRILAFAYIAVWSWHEHLTHSQMRRQAPKKRLALLMDEVEAHLHPRWQRSIVPSLTEVVTHLSAEVSVELHLTTHSPLVLASAETVFIGDKDDLHHLKLEGKEVVLERLPFVKRGPADMWLMSDVFGLGQARSIPAEEAMRDAMALQAQKSPRATKVRDVNRRLVRYLASDDEFWPLWRYFAKQHGVR